jgi:hypothetical protein
MMTLAALLYADARSTVNQCKAIRRSPGRAIMWGLFVLFIVAGIAVRVLRAADREHMRIEMLSPQLSTDAIVCFALAALGLAVAAGSKLAGLFAHPAEARFIIGSPATPFIATLYVQTRDIIVTSARRGIALLYAALIYLPDGLSVGGFLRDVVLIVLGFTAVAAVPLARQLLAKRLVPFAIALGWLLIVAGLAPVARDIATAVELPLPFGLIVHALPAWHPGRILLATAGPQYLTIAAVLAVSAALFLFVARRARDAYPELYELSMNRLHRTEKLRARMFGMRAVRSSQPVKVASMGAAAPAGVAIFVWRAWTEYRRSNDARATGIETGCCLLAGYALARFSGGHLKALLPVATTFSTVLFLVALARAAVLANELRRPLFWLSSATLFERLWALAVAHSWRMIGWFVLAAIGMAAGGAPFALIAAALFCGPAAVLLAVAIGYASYALLPNEIDQRGPMLFVRWILGYILLLPAVAAGILAFIITQAAVPGIAGGSITGLLEAALLIGFASWRLDNMSISSPRA